VRTPPNVANLWAGPVAGRWSPRGVRREPLPVAYGAALLATLRYGRGPVGRRTRGRGVRGRHIGASLLVYARAARPGPDRPARGDRAGHRTAGASLRLQRHARRPRRRRPAPGRAGRGHGRLLALGIRPVLRRERTFTDAGPPLHREAWAGIPLGSVGSRIGIPVGYTA